VVQELCGKEEADLMGYTPLFDTLTEGTLCGRWPDIGLWPIVLSMSDKNGVVDKHFQFIANVTGLSMDDVIACMERFCQPDSYSRSQEKNGARLELLDPERPWGWRIINHGKYREKARLTAKNAREVESGYNRERMQTAEDRRSPPETAAERPSKLQTHTSNNKTKNQEIPQEVIEKVFDHWRTTFDHPRAQLDDKRTKTISKALERYSEADVCQAISGYQNSAFHMGQNEDGKTYDSLGLILRDAEKIEDGIRLYESPPQPKTKGQLSQDANVAATRAWLERSNGTG
jgi:hypothetical protein